MAARVLSETRRRRKPAITGRHLLTHTAGFGHGFDEPYRQVKVSEGLDQPGISMEENLRRIASVPLRFEPGTSWGCSVATDILGEVVSRVAPKSLPVAIKELITRPLEMDSTGFAPPMDLTVLVTPYADDFGLPDLTRIMFI